VKLVPASDPILSTPPQRFDFTNPPMDPSQLLQDLKDAMVKHRGVGLSANQVGIPYQVFVVGDPNDPDNIVGLFNPKVVFQSEQVVTIEEGCLTYPGLFLKVDRSAIVRVRCADVFGKVNTHMYDGLPARVILHEMDHMNGTNFTQHVSRLKLDRAKQQKKKLDKLRQINMERLAKYG
jgi:peptide deformylase